LAHLRAPFRQIIPRHDFLAKIHARKNKSKKQE
jgi:hypothetical protein